MQNNNSSDETSYIQCFFKSLSHQKDKTSKSCKIENDAILNIMTSNDVFTQFALISKTFPISVIALLHMYKEMI